MIGKHTKQRGKAVTSHWSGLGVQCDGKTAFCKQRTDFQIHMKYKVKCRQMNTCPFIIAGSFHRSCHITEEDNNASLIFKGLYYSSVRCRATLIFQQLKWELKTTWHFTKLNRQVVMLLLPC